MTSQPLHRARYARRSDLRPLLAPSYAPNGMLLGTYRPWLFSRQLVTVKPTPQRPELGNLLIVGRTRSGKGLLATSQLLTWQYPAIVNDIKGELFAQTAGFRSLLGPVYVLDPTGVGHRYDPLAGKVSEDDVYASATHLLYQADEREQIFTQRATTMLTCMFLAARREHAAPLPYVRMMLDAGLSGCVERLHAVSPQLATIFLNVSFERAILTDRFLLSAWGTLDARMRPLLTETVLRTLSGSDFTPAEIMTGSRPVTIYLRWPEQKLLPLAPLVRLFWGSLIDELVTTYDQRSGRGCQPVMLLIDEAGRTAIPALADHATTVVGRGLSLWVAVQSLSQLEVVYGKARVQVLRDNMDSQIFYRPNDQATAEYLERRLGRRSAYAHHTTAQKDHTSEGRSEQAIPLLSAYDFMQFKDHEVIGVHGALPPFKLERMDWRQHPTLQQRRAQPAPAVPTLAPLADMPLLPGIDRPASYKDPDQDLPLAAMAYEKSPDQRAIDWHKLIEEALTIPG